MELSLNVNGSTKIIGLLGKSLEHSTLPKLHNIITKIIGLNLIYVPFCVNEDKLGEAISGLKAINVLGFNVTNPYKKEIIKHIDDNMRLSFLMGAVNTVKNIDGRFYGYNTDAEGFIRAAKNHNMDFENKVITIFGAGVAARSIAVKLAYKKASKVNIINRDLNKAKSIKNAINDNIKDIVDVYTYNAKQFFDVCRESDILVNATSVGMFPNINECVVDSEKIFKKNQFVYDIVYNPRNTLFLEMAKRKGCKVMNGFSMLFCQSILSYEIWTGYKFNHNEIDKIYNLLG